MAHHTSTTRLLSPLLSSFRSLTLSSTKSPLVTKPSTTSLTTSLTNKSTFSTTSCLSNRPAGKNSKNAANKTDPRISLIRYHLQHPKTPRPLKLSRMRALRHWTIHRAWMLARRKREEAHRGELYRMYQSMHSACEALRNLDPPGTKDAGRLYRIAMEKKGIFQHGGVPIEYARAQTETPGREPWNHGWTR